MDQKICNHENFEASVDTHRLNKSEGGPIVSYLVELTLRCAECKIPFRFFVPRVGVFPNDSGTNANGEMLNVYAEPSDGSLAQAIRPGYSVSVSGGSLPTKN